MLALFTGIDQEIKLQNLHLIIHLRNTLDEHTTVDIFRKFLNLKFLHWMSGGMCKTAVSPLCGLQIQPVSVRFWKGVDWPHNWSILCVVQVWWWSALEFCCYCWWLAPSKAQWDGSILITSNLTRMYFSINIFSIGMDLSSWLQLLISLHHMELPPLRILNIFLRIVFCLRIKNVKDFSGAPPECESELSWHGAVEDEVDHAVLKQFIWDLPLTDGGCTH